MRRAFDDDEWIDEPSHRSIVVFEEGTPGDPKDTGLLDQYGNRILYQPPKIKMGFEITREHIEEVEDGNFYFAEPKDE